MHKTQQEKTKMRQEKTNTQQEKKDIMNNKKDRAMYNRTKVVNNNNKGPTMLYNEVVGDTKKIVQPRSGSGCLVLKNGEFGAVIWTLRLLENGIQSGDISGNNELIRLAARDKSATLRVTPRFSIAIAVGRRRADKAAFTLLLARDDAPFFDPFEAQTILGLGTTSDGKSVVIEFVAASGEQRTVVVPIRIIRDSISHLQEIVNNGPAAAVSPADRCPKTWHTASAQRHPLIYVVFDEDRYALTPKNARLLAAELVERANEMEGRLPAEPPVLQ